MLKKQFLADKKTCKVTFEIDHGAASEAHVVSIVGDFNGWDPSSDPMKPTKGGGFSKTLNLKCGDSYQFRYIIDDTVWENDAAADDYVPTPYGGDNSVVDVSVP